MVYIMFIMIILLVSKLKFVYKMSYNHIKSVPHPDKGELAMLLTIQDVINKLLTSSHPLEQTVDIIEWGDPTAPVTGIATCFMPTQYVLEQAVALGVNLLITHENVFYNHHNRYAQLEHDSVYLQKRAFIESSQLHIFRIHDYIHQFQPDGITLGLLQALEWETYVTEHRNTASIIALPEASLGDIAAYIKEKLGISYVRLVGNPEMRCSHVAVMVGYRGGGEHAIPFYERDHVDLIIAGEGPEWETPEYVRDAIQQHKPRALLMLGHAESEAPGMKWLATELNKQISSIPVHFISDKPLYQII